MNQQSPGIEAGKCDPCPAFKGVDGSAAWVSKFSVIPSRLAAQVTDGVWNAVVTTFGKGTFLIRRARSLSVHACPLRTYVVRHVAADPPPSRNPLVQEEMELSSAIDV